LNINLPSDSWNVSGIWLRLHINLRQNRLLASKPTTILSLFSITGE
jgi:hypothetical protein